MSFVLLRRVPSVAISSEAVMLAPAGSFPRGEPPQKRIDISDTVKLMRSGCGPASDEHANAAIDRAKGIFVSHIVTEEHNGWAGVGERLDVPGDPPHAVPLVARDVRQVLHDQRAVHP